MPVTVLLFIIGFLPSVVWADSPRVKGTAAAAMSRTLNGAVLIEYPTMYSTERDGAVLAFNERSSAEGICSLFGFGAAVPHSLRAEAWGRFSATPSMIVDDDGVVTGSNDRRDWVLAINRTRELRVHVNTNSIVAYVMCTEPRDWALWHELAAPEHHRFEDGAERPTDEALLTSVTIANPRIAGHEHSPGISANSDLDGVCRALGFARALRHLKTCRQETYYEGRSMPTLMDVGESMDFATNHLTTVAVKINEHGYFESYTSLYRYQMQRHEYEYVLASITCI